MWNITRRVVRVTICLVCAILLIVSLYYYTHTIYGLSPQRSLTTGKSPSGSSDHTRQPVNYTRLHNNSPVESIIKMAGDTRLPSIHPVKNVVDTGGVEYDFTSVDEAFFRSVRTHVEGTQEFPWHLVDREKLYAGSGVLEYMDKWVIQGSPFEPLEELTNPCWYQKAPDGGPILACMPRFYVAGFPKCGTTDLYHALLQHPDVAANRKEHGYWTKHTVRDFHSYIKQFDKTALILWEDLKRNNRSRQITFDADPSIIWRPAAYPVRPHIAEDMRNLAILKILGLRPDTKVMVIVRNPTDRTISHFTHMNKGNTVSYMYKEVKRTVERLSQCIQEKGVRYCAYYGETMEAAHAYVLLRIGLYCVFIKDLLDLYPRDQIHFIKAEDYYHDRSDVMKDAFTFLGLDHITADLLENITSHKVENRGTDRGRRLLPSKEDGDWVQATRDLLIQFFKPFNDKLADLLDDPRYLTWNSE